MERLRDGVKVAFELGDLACTYGLGVTPGLMKLEDREADVFARIVARKADEGAQWAIEQVAQLTGYADYVEAGLIFLGHSVNVIAEVKENGINPFFLRKPIVAD